MTRLAAATARLVDGLGAPRATAGVPFTTNQVCGMFGLFFTPPAPVTNYREVMASDVAPLPAVLPRHAGRRRLPRALAFEAGFVSAAHGEAEIEATIEAAGRVFAASRAKPDARPRLVPRGDPRHAGARGAARLAGVAGRACDRAGMAVPQDRQPALAAPAAARAASSRVRRLGLSQPRGLGLRIAAPAVPAPGGRGLRDRARDHAADDDRDASRSASARSRPGSRRGGRARRPSRSARSMGLAVAIVEETFFRGLMFRAVSRESGYRARRVAHGDRLLGDPFPRARARYRPAKSTGTAGLTCSASRSRTSPTRCRCADSFFTLAARRPAARRSCANARARSPPASACTWAGSASSRRRRTSRP